MSAELLPCPACGKKPDRFSVGGRNIDVISCQQGCLTHPMGIVIHITSDWAPDWPDIADAWNTMEVTPREDGCGLHVRFDASPPIIPAKSQSPLDPSPASE